jgi:hypothetical protein
MLIGKNPSTPLGRCSNGPSFWFIYLTSSIPDAQLVSFPFVVDQFELEVHANRG